MLIILMVPVNAFAVPYFGPYVVYDESVKTLTYYYGNPIETALPLSVLDAFEIVDYDINFDSHSNVEKIVIDESFANYKPTTLAFAFSNFEEVTSFEGLYYLDTSEATTMQSMFDGDFKLTSLDLSTFNTSKVENMDWMFCACTNLESLTLNFDTSKVVSMPNMFSACSSLKILDLRSFDTRNCEDFTNMFMSCTNLLKIYASENLVIAKDTAVYTDVFSGCFNLYGDFGTGVPSVPVEEDQKALFHIDKLNNPGLFSNGTSFNIQIESATIKMGQTLDEATVTGTVTKDGVTIPGEFAFDEDTHVFKEEDIDQEFIVTFYPNSFIPKSPLQVYTKLTVIEEPKPTEDPKPEEKSPKTGVDTYLPIPLGLSLSGFLGAVMLKRKEEK